MSRIKNITLLFAVCLLLAGLLAGCGAEENFGRLRSFTNEDNQKQYVLENDALKLTMDGKTGYFTLEDKENGKVWNSVPEIGANDPMADTTTKRYMQSTMILTYTSRNGMDVVYDNYEYAIKNGTVQIEEQEDGLRLNYTVGTMERQFIIPEVITESRMLSFIDQMEKFERGTVLKYYKKLDMNKLSEKDDPKALLEQYPSLETEPVYVLLASAKVTISVDYEMQDYQKEELEEYFGDVGYTYDDYLLDKDPSAEAQEQLCFNVAMNIRLDGDSLVVDVPEEQMYYPAEHPIKSVQILPYFCAADTQQEGFLLVPDGGGAQIFLNNGKTNQSAYYANVYGWNEAFAREQLVQDTTARFPAFGIQYGGGYILGIAEQGDSELSVEADISGKRSSINYVKPVFSVVHGEATRVSAKSDVTVMVFEENISLQTYTMRYLFGSGDSYVDMAQRFRAYLTDKYPALKENQTDGVPLAVDVIGAIDLQEKVLGLPVNKTVVATDYAETLQIVQTLQAGGVKSLDLQYSAMINGGMKQKALTKISKQSGLGSKKELTALIQAMQDTDALYLSGYVSKVMSDGMLDGFSASGDAIRDTANAIIERYPYSAVLGTAQEGGDISWYLLKKDNMQKAIENLSAASHEWQFDGVAFEELGTLLYSDFGRQNATSRDEMAQMQAQALEQLRQSGQKVMTTGGNLYSAVWSDFVVLLDLCGNSYNLIDRQVPFYQIALHGLVDYAAQPLNEAENYEKLVLKSVETGAGLYYRFLEMDYEDLKDSKYTWDHYRLYSCHFADWQDKLLELYGRIDRELGHTYSMEITDHSYLTENVTVTEYADGTRVYVNYSKKPYTVDGVSVPAEDFAVVGGGGK